MCYQSFIKSDRDINWLVDQFNKLPGKSPNDPVPDYPPSGPIPMIETYPPAPKPENFTHNPPSTPFNLTTKDFMLPGNETNSTWEKAFYSNYPKCLPEGYISSSDLKGITEAYEQDRTANNTADQPIVIGTLTVDKFRELSTCSDFTAQKQLTVIFSMVFRASKHFINVAKPTLPFLQNCFLQYIKIVSEQPVGKAPIEQLYDLLHNPDTPVKAGPPLTNPPSIQQPTTIYQRSANLTPETTIIRPEKVFIFNSVKMAASADAPPTSTQIQVPPDAPQMIIVAPPTQQMSASIGSFSEDGTQDGPPSLHTFLRQTQAAAPPFINFLSLSPSITQNQASNLFSSSSLSLSSSSLLSSTPSEETPSSTTAAIEETITITINPNDLDPFPFQEELDRNRNSQNGPQSGEIVDPIVSFNFVRGLPDWDDHYRWHSLLSMIHRYR